MIASNKLFAALGVFLLAGLGLAIFRGQGGDLSNASALWMFALALLGLMAMVDSFSRAALKHLHIARHVPNSIPQGDVVSVKLVFKNAAQRSLLLTVEDHFSSGLVQVSTTPSVQLLANSEQSLVYRVRGAQRGDAQFPCVQVICGSRFGLWRFSKKYPLISSTRVYPNYTRLGDWQALLNRRDTKSGQHLMQRRGDGLDFHQLRDYRDGDAQRQIDWKASSRRQKLISKDYREERDQDVVFLLDNGRRMRTKDGELSHFDHSLNAVLRLASVAMNMGDSIALLSGSDHTRWIPPVKGSGGLTRLIASLYDLHSNLGASDHVRAATKLRGYCKKRSLIIWVTNFDHEERDQIFEAVQLLNKKHLLLLVNLGEMETEEIIEERVTNYEQAVATAVACIRSEDIRSLEASLRRQRVTTLHSTPPRLHLDLIQEYLRMKRSGII